MVDRVTTLVHLDAWTVRIGNIALAVKHRSQRLVGGIAQPGQNEQLVPEVNQKGAAKSPRLVVRPPLCKEATSNLIEVLWHL